MGSSSIRAARFYVGADVEVVSRYRRCISEPVQLIVCCLWLAWPVCLQAQHAQVSDTSQLSLSEDPAALHFDRLSIRDGLSQKDVYAILQDRQGFMWFGTRYGLNRYDGYSFSMHRNAPFDAASLSDNWILALSEDRAGGLWVGTVRGLNRLDPATGRAVRYRHDPDDPHSLSHDLIWAVHEDTDGALWVGTQGGLNRLDRATGRFTRYVHDPEVPHSLSSDRVYALHEDRQGHLWVSTANGLNRLNRPTGRFTRYLYNERLPREERSDILYGIAAEPEGRPHVIRGISDDPVEPEVLWIGTEGGLLRLDAQTGQSTRYVPDPDDPDRSIVMNVVPDPVASGILWLTTNGGGLYRFDTRTQHFVPYRHDPHVPTSIGGDKLGALYVDGTGVIWAGTFGDGVSKFHPARAGFVWFQHLPGEPNSLSHNDVWTIHEDRSGALWIGTNMGLNRFERETGTFTHYVHDPRDPSSLSSSNINFITEDRNGTLWIATYGGGLNRFDRKTGHSIHYRHDPDDPTSLGSDFASYLIEDRTGTLWVGTWGAGLHAFDRHTGLFTRHRHDPTDSSSISDDRIVDIYEDAAGRLWVGTYDGLNQFIPATPASISTGSVERPNPSQGRFIRYQYDLTDDGGLSHPGVYSIHERAREPGVLWLATPGGGLNRLDTRTGEFTHFTEEAGLSNNRVLGMLEDEAGRLWMSTADGLSRFDPDSRTFRNYSVSSGLQVKEFNPMAYFKGRSGEMFFGGVDGMQAFSPERILEESTPPPVVLTEFSLFNEPVAVGPGGVLPRPLSQTDEIRLGSRQKMLTFEFVALHYLNSTQNQYAYRLEGFDEDWVMAGTRRTATYTNLDPGSYTFRVKASNSDGVWNEAGTSVRIAVAPPWWQTWWAYGLYVSMLGAGVFGVNRIQRRRLIRQEREKARIREARIKARAAEERARSLQDIDQLKSRFFANISHEFRTPLTIITGLVEDLLAGARKPDVSDLREQHRRILQSARRLLRLVGQLLDLAKLESGRMELQRQTGDVAAFLHDLVQAFNPLAERRQITLRFQSARASQSLHFDQEMLEKVFSNLLSNALRFTPEGGKVWVTLGTRTIGQEPVVEAVVKDTGRGIAREALPRIFDRFEQVSGAAARAHGGTGIGLALAKELVERHGGRILVESEPGFGSAFVVRLPMDAAHPEQDQASGGDGKADGARAAGTARAADATRGAGSAHAAEGDSAVGSAHAVDSGSAAGSAPTAPRADSVVLEEAALSSESARPDLSKTAAALDEKAPTVLIVEDNAEVRAYLRKHLEATYHIQEASDGAAGLETARKTKPDLVVSDVMMPEMDGHTLCSAIKADDRLRTIPVILLTAKAGEEETVQGLESGADDYVVKPFSVDELKARVATLIRARRQARRQFSREIVVQPAEITIQSADEAFLERVLAVVEARLGENGFDAGAMADAVGLSRRHLERRLAAVAGETPAELLRRMRLERARQLLEARSGTIAEVAYAVGFRSPAHFSTSFRKAFGLSPSSVSENAS